MFLHLFSPEVNTWLWNVTFVTANYLWNHILYPDKKLDYGFLIDWSVVKLIVNGRIIFLFSKDQISQINVDCRWGTRCAHIFTIGLPLAIADHLSIDMWNRFLLPKIKYSLGTKLSIMHTPGPYLFHIVSYEFRFFSFLFSNWIFVYDRFAFTSIMIYIAWDAYANPNHKDRVGFFNSKVYPELQGCQSMYMLPLVSGMVEYLSGKHRPHGTLLGLLAPTAVRLSFFIFSFFSFWFFFV